MIRIDDHKTPYILDPFGYLGPKRRKQMERSWAGLFRKYILTELPVEVLAKKFPSRTGHPTKEIYAMLGALLIQQMFNLTDEETVEQFSFNIMWHYALDIVDTSDDSSYVSLKTLWNMRQIVTVEHLHDIIFDKVTKKLIDSLKVSTDNQRLDSMHIVSNMRHLGRLGIFVETIRKFLANLKRHHRPLLLELDDELVARYLDRRQRNAFSMVKPSESRRKIKEVADDLFLLVEWFSGHYQVAGMTSYQQMLRVLREQCLIEESPDHEKQVVVRENKEVSSSSLQNPSDPDAGYDAHKGKGYQVQLAETYSETKDEDDHRPLALITYAEAEPAHHSDAQAVKPMLEKLAEQEHKPTQLLADSLYGSDDNCTFAQENGTELIAPTMGTPKDGFNTFTFADDGKVITCPAGHAPWRIHHNARKGRISACFQHQLCSTCELRDICPTQHAKKGRYLRYRHKDIRLLRRRAFEQTDTFHQKYRFRSGIEATNSEMDRRTGIKNIRYRGLLKVSYCTKLKAAALNILRAAAYLRQQREHNPDFQPQCEPMSMFLRFKERFVGLKKKIYASLASRLDDVSTGIALVA